MFYYKHILCTVTKLNGELNDTMFPVLYNISEKVHETSIQSNHEYLIEQDCFVKFVASFTANNGYCRISVFNANDEVVYAIQINPAPVVSNAQISGELLCRKGWKFKLGANQSLTNGSPKYAMTY